MTEYTQGAIQVLCFTTILLKTTCTQTNRVSEEGDWLTLVLSASATDGDELMMIVLDDDVVSDDNDEADTIKL